MEMRLPEPPKSLTSQLTWSTVLTAAYMLIGAHWLPVIVDAQVFSLVVIALAAALTGLHWNKRGPHPMIVGCGILLGFVVAMLVAVATGSRSPLPAWLNNNAGALQAIAAVAGLFILGAQSRFIAWQAKISAAQAELNQRMVDLEANRDVAKLRIEDAILVSDSLLELTVLNKGNHGSEVESVVLTPIDGEPLTGDLSPPLTDNPEGGQPLHIQPGTRMTFYAGFRAWPPHIQYPLEADVVVTPVLGEPVTHRLKVLKSPGA